MNYYRQCVLVRGTSYDIAWIPEEFAVKGKYIRVKDEDGWQVQIVGIFRRDGEYLQSHERDYLGHRDRTDA